MKKMHYLSISEILTKRKKCGDQGQAIEVQQQMQVDPLDNIDPYLAIDQLIKKISQKRELGVEDREMLISIIRQKTGTCLNQQVFSKHLTASTYIQAHQLQKFIHRPAHNYFVLKGRLRIYAYKQQGRSAIIKNQLGKTVRNLKSEQDELLQSVYDSFEHFELANMDYQLMEQLQDFRGYGHYFNKEREKEGRKCRLLTENAIIIQFPNIEPGQFALFNDGISAQEKLQMLQSFPVLRPLGRRIQACASHFIFKKYIRNEQIYKRGDKANCIYLIAKGQIGFQTKLREETIDNAIEEEKVSPKASLTQADLLNLSTETIGKGSYFGQEEIFMKVARLQTARCISAECYLFELEKDKFDKLCEYTEFSEPMVRAAAAKRAQRCNKFKKARIVLNKYFEQQEKQMQISEVNQNPKLDRFADSRQATKRKGSQPRIMHGAIVRYVPYQISSTEPLNFSMLKANPDMYESTLKKFRKYNIKPVEKVKPEVNWNLTRVWKVLNLQDILREESEINSPEGRKFFDSHRRYVNQINQSKSLRPKTSSSTYRTKLQYIAYLQKFNK